MPEPGFASLGPTLLARKGGAKPAMRPQLPPLAADEQEIAQLADEQLEDLGWNDMGEASETGAEIVSIHTGSAPHHAEGAHAGPIVRRQQRRLEERLLADAAMTGANGTDENTYEDEDEDADWDAAHDAVPAFAADDEYDEDEGEEGALDEAAFASLAPTPVAVPAAIPAAMPAPAPRAAMRSPAVRQGRRAAFTLRLDAERHLKLRLAATMQGVSAQVLLTEALDRLLAEFDELDSIAAKLKRH